MYCPGAGVATGRNGCRSTTLVASKYYGLSDMEMTMKCIYGYQYPSAQLSITNDHGYIFEAGDNYCYWQMAMAHSSCDSRAI
jgi:hypothetical protein